MTDSRFFTRRSRRLDARGLARVASAFFISTTAPVHAAQPMTDDPYLWLEDVSGTQALDWVRARNTESQHALESRPDYAPTYAKLLSIYNSRDRIPSVTRRGDKFYNFWQDEQHKRGI